MSIIPRIMLVAVILGLALSVTGFLLATKASQRNSFATDITLFSALAFLALIVNFSLNAPWSGTRGEEQELTSIRKERSDILERVADAPQPNILDTIQLGLNQLTEYYTINKGQARNSFNASIVSVFLGFVVLLVGLTTFYFQKTPNLQMTAITGVAGVLLEFLGGAHFFLYRKSLEQLNLYFNQLTRTQDTMLAVRLCQDLEDSAKKTEVMEKVILHVLERGPLAVGPETKPKPAGALTVKKRTPNGRTPAAP